jgi:hypothetical protein
LHLYPLFYWDWPHSSDKTDPLLMQYERDWMWFAAWARYAWNPDRDGSAERDYWTGRLAARYGGRKAAALILNALNDAGECAPRLLRRFGITEGNRQTFSLGMTLGQLVDPAPFKPYPELWLSQAPPGERLREYAEKEWHRQAHTGETPPQILEEVLGFSRDAVDAILEAEPHVSKNKEEFQRIKNDIDCIRALCLNYAAKVNAALCVLRFRHSGDIADLNRAEKHLEESLRHFRVLTALTKESYRYAQSLLTYHRRIPFPGEEDGKPVNYHWTQVLPLYEKELADFKAFVDSKKNSEGY